MAEAKDIKIYIDDYLKKQGFTYADESIVTDIYNISTFKSGDTFIRGRERIDEILYISVIIESSA